MKQAIIRHGQTSLYHALPDICCPGGSPWCTYGPHDLSMNRSWGREVVIIDTSRVADQVHALNCTVSGSNPCVSMLECLQTSFLILFPFFVRLSRSCHENFMPGTPKCPVLCGSDLPWYYCTNISYLTFFCLFSFVLLPPVQ